MFKRSGALKALIQNEYGDPAKVLQLKEVPKLFPEAGQVIVDIEAAVVHVADARTVVGTEGFRKPLPRTPGYEGVGRVSDVAQDVKGVTVGMRVFAPLGSGTYREQVAAVAADLQPAPEGDPVQVALLSLSPATAMMMLLDFVSLKPGDFVLQNAANSAVGRMVVQLASDMKVSVINVVKSTGVITELKEIGAGVVLTDTADLRNRVAAVTQGSPVVLAIDAVGGESTSRLASCLDDGATVVNYSAMSGAPCQMPTDLLVRDIKLCGLQASRQLAKKTPEERMALYTRVGELLAAGRLRGRLGGTYPLENAVDAIRHVIRDGDKRVGRVVIRVREVPPPAQAGVPMGEFTPASDASAAAPAAPATEPATAPGEPTQPAEATEAASETA